MHEKYLYYCFCYRDLDKENEEEIYCPTFIKWLAYYPLELSIRASYAYIECDRFDHVYSPY